MISDDSSPSFCPSVCFNGQPLPRVFGRVCACMSGWLHAYTPLPVSLFVPLCVCVFVLPCVFGVCMYVCLYVCGLKQLRLCVCVCVCDCQKPHYSHNEEYHSESSRGSDLSDIMEEDEEELYSEMQLEEGRRRNSHNTPKVQFFALILNPRVISTQI